MLIKWDTLLVAVALVGGSVLIENSHRVDTGTPDDEVTASAPAESGLFQAFRAQKITRYVGDVLLFANDRIVHPSHVRSGDSVCEFRDG